MKLKFPHQVVPYENEGNVKATSIGTHQILNRLYIGQFEELRDPKEETLTKAIPCRRVFPFGDNIEELQSLDINISDCKLIFNIRYYPTNNEWNPFKALWPQFGISIAIEWGIYLGNEKPCPWAATVLTALRVNEADVLIDYIKDELIKYTCSSACGDDANICDNANHSIFRSSLQRTNSHVPFGLFLAINDLKVADSCIFNTVF